MQLQVVNKEEFVRRAKKQQERTVELAPSRGALLDATGKPLAVSVLADSVFAIPSDVENVSKTAAALAPLLGLPAKEIERKLSNLDRDFVWLARRVPDDTAARVRARTLAGIRLTKESTRRYPEGSLAASVLGYVGTDNQGLGGLEHRYDTVIIGQPSRVTFLRDAAQRSYAVRSRVRTAEGTEGSTLVLTLDARIQHVAERELARVLRETHAKSASAVVLDPDDGCRPRARDRPRLRPDPLRGRRRRRAALPAARRCVRTRLHVQGRHVRRGARQRHRRRERRRRLRERGARDRVDDDPRARPQGLLDAAALAGARALFQHRERAPRALPRPGPVLQVRPRVRLRAAERDRPRRRDARPRRRARRLGAR